MSFKKYRLFFLLAICLVGVLGVAISIWLRQPNVAQVDETLSEQSANRLTRMKKAASIENTVRESSHAAGTTVSTSCFTTAVPLPYGSIREDSDRCWIRIQLAQPRGTLVIHAEDQAAIQTMADLTAVSFRLDNDTYESIQLNSPFANTRTFLSQNELTAFVYQDSVLITISFSELAQTNQEVIAAAESILTELKIVTVENRQ